MDVRSLIQQALPIALGGLLVSTVPLLARWLWKVGKRLWIRKSEIVEAIDPERKNGQNALLTVSAFVVSIALFEFVGPAVSEHFVSGASVDEIKGHRWITYDPLGDLDLIHDERLDLSSSKVEPIRKELSWIRQAGFDGIITFSSKGGMRLIPQLAKEQGLSVIMGVWNPRDTEEIIAAISQSSYVDAYCVGHDGWAERRYSFDELANAIGYVRFHTWRPVTTTERLDFYFAHSELLSIGDWIFPDAHVSIKEGINIYRADAQRDTRQVIEWSKLIAARPEREGKPILLKMIAYPVNGISNASLQEQSSFFISLFEIRRDVMSELPADVSVSIHSAFDIPWKTGWPFYEWERYTGLLDRDGTPRPAAREIVMRSP